MGPPPHVPTDPARLSPADRTRAVAALLAAGLLRLALPTHPAGSDPAEPSKFRTNDLAVRCGTSVTARAGDGTESTRFPVDRR